MSGQMVTGKVRNAAPVGIQDTEDLPIDPSDGGVQVHIVGGVAIVINPEPPTSIIYSTPDAAGGGTGFEHHSIIPAAALPGSLASIYATLQPSPPNATSYYIQIFLGVVLPAPGAIPLLVGDSLVTPGGNEQFIPPDEINRITGFTVVVSTTQAFFTDPGAGITVLRTRAWGR